MKELVWLALAMHLTGKKCPICGQTWNSREDVVSTKPKCSYEQGAVCSKCWDEYEKRHKEVSK